MFIVQLNLPAPSQSVLDQIKTFANSAQFDPDNKRWLDEFHHGAVNSALISLGQVDPAINDQMIQEFQTFFPQHKIKSSIGIMKNGSGRPACLPPHTDRGRTLGINYYVDLGGDQVETVFYNESRSAQTVAANIPLDQTGEVLERAVLDHGWYAFRANYCHSVENIQTTRIFTTLRILPTESGTLDGAEFVSNVSDYDLDSLIKDYPQLIKE